MSTTLLKDLGTFRNMLRLNKHRLDDEVELQAQMLEAISEQVAVHGARTQASAEKLKQAEATAYLNHKDAGDSDKVAEQRTRRDTGRVAAFNELQFNKTAHERWLGMYEAWKARGYTLHGLVTLYGAQYFAVDAAHSVVRAERPSSDERPRRDYAAERLQRQADAPAETREQLAGRLYSEAAPTPTQRTRRKST